METELREEVYPISGIAGIRFKVGAEGSGHFEANTQYAGYEEESNWQPLENVSHLAAFADFMKRDHTTMVREEE